MILHAKAFGLPGHLDHLITDHSHHCLSFSFVCLCVCSICERSQSAGSSWNWNMSRRWLSSNSSKTRSNDFSGSAITYSTQFLFKKNYFLPLTSKCDLSVKVIFTLSTLSSYIGSWLYFMFTVSSNFLWSYMWFQICNFVEKFSTKRLLLSGSLRTFVRILLHCEKLHKRVNLRQRCKNPACMMLFNIHTVFCYFISTVPSYQMEKETL